MRVLMALLIGCVSACLSAEETSVRPGINQRYLAADANVVDWVQRFETESREVYVGRQAIVEAVGLELGMTVADVGAGTGLFVPLFAARIGASGHVYAVDIAPKFAVHIRDRVAANDLTNVSVVLSSERSVTLPPRSVDVVFLCNVYHHIEYPQTVLASISAALRPAGRLVILDFERIPGQTRAWVMGHVRSDRDTVIEEIEAAGFVLTETLDVEGLIENYMLRFTKL